MAAVGLRKKFMLKSDSQTDSVKMAEIMKISMKKRKKKQIK